MSKTTTIYWVVWDLDNVGVEVDLFAKKEDFDKKVRDHLREVWEVEFADEPSNSFPENDELEEIYSILHDTGWGSDNYIYWDEQNLEL